MTLSAHARNEFLRKVLMQLEICFDYSVNGFSELSYVSPDEAARADDLADVFAELQGDSAQQGDPRDEKIAALESLMAALRDTAWEFYCDLGGGS